MPAQTKCQVKNFERALDFRVLSVLIVYTTIHHLCFGQTKAKEMWCATGVAGGIARCNRRYANGCFSADMKYHITSGREKKWASGRWKCAKKLAHTSATKSKKENGKTDALCSSNSWHWQLLLLHVFFLDFFFSFLCRLLAPRSLASFLPFILFLASFTWCFVTLLMAMQGNPWCSSEEAKKTKKANEWSVFAWKLANQKRRKKEPNRKN